MKNNPVPKPDRSMCCVLENMRQADEAKNYSYTKALIEEAQFYASRMEDAFEEYKSIYCDIYRELESDNTQKAKLTVIKDILDNKFIRQKWGLERRKEDEE